MEDNMNITIEEIIGKPFTFTKRPEHLPCEMRPLWRCSLILMIFSLVSKNDTCSLKKLHVVNWILKSDKNSTDYEYWTINKGTIKPEVRLDPTLDRAIELLLSEGFLMKDNEKYKITEKGNDCVLRLKMLNIFNDECMTLLKHKKGLSETNINKIFQVG